MIKALPSFSGWTRDFVKSLLHLMSSRDTTERDCFTQFIISYLLNSPQEIQFLYPILSQEIQFLYPILSQKLLITGNDLILVEFTLLYQ